MPDAISRTDNSAGEGGVGPDVIFEGVQTIAALAAIGPEDRADKQIILVEDNNTLYNFDIEDTTVDGDPFPPTVDTDDLVIPNDNPVAGRWKKTGDGPGATHKDNHTSGGSDPFVVADVLEAASRAVRISLRNESGSPLSKGDLVSISGFSVPEGRPIVDLADKDLAAFRPAIAVVEASVANNTNFEGLVVGLLTGLDTSAFVVNAQLVLGDDGAVSSPPPDTDPFTGEVQLIGSVVRSDVTNGSIYFLLSSTLLPMTAAQTFWVKEAATTGSISGGDVTRVSGLDVAVSSGTGFVNIGGTLFRVTWSAVSNLTLTAPAATYFIFVDSAGVVTASTSLPSSESNIVLATAITDGTTVVFLANHKILLPERAAKAHQYTEDVIGPITVSGLITTKSATDLQLDVDVGTFYTRDFRVDVPLTNDITFTYWHRDGSGGFTKLLSQTTIDPENFDDGSGSLVAIPAGNWKKDLLFIASTSSGVVEYHIFYAQETFSSQSAAEAGNLPSADSDVLDNSIRSGGVVIQKSAVVITSVVDVRPFLGQLSPGTTAPSDHGLLSGLGDDDHPIYLPADGSRAMTGTLDMGTSPITNVGLVDGVDVSAHAARHQDGGADEVATVTPAADAIPKAGAGSELDAGWLPDSVREETFTWNINGSVTTGIAIDGHRVMRRAGTIVGITMSLGSRGNNGNIIVDVNKHVPSKPITTQRNNTAGVTIYTTQGNRPTLVGLTGSASDNAVIEAAAPDVISFLAGDFLSMDVDSSVVNDMDLDLDIHVQYS